MKTYRRIAVGEGAPGAVTLGIEKGPDGQPVSVVWWPSHGDVDADEKSYPSVQEGLAAAEAARELHDFDEVVVALQSDELWQEHWGRLQPPPGPALTDEEGFELARATEASRDA